MAAVSGNANKTLVCQNPHSYGHKDIWHLGNPFDSPTCLLFMQASLITVVTQFLDICLRQLGQSSLVSQILVGVMFGPSFLGNKKILGQTLFPVKGSVVLETTASFGLMFFYFVWCVKMDLATLLKTEKLAITIGISVFTLTLVIPTGLSFVLKKYVPMDTSLSNALPFLAISQTLTVFISIAVLLTDLKFLNTDIGRLTMSAAMFADIAGFSLTMIMFAILQNKGGSIVTLVGIILSMVVLLLIIVFVMRPTIIWMVEHPGGGSVNELCIVCIFLFVLLSGLMSELIGQHFAMGPILLGLSVPEGPPIGTALMSKLETISLAFLYPIYLAVNGMQTDFFKIDFQSLWVVCFILIVAFFVKIGAVMLPGYYYNLPMKECCVVGLLLNGRGIAEISMYNLWMGTKLLSEQEYALMVASIVVINAIIAPLIKFIYDPSEQYETGRRCTIQHNRRESELRVMVCIQNNENIPTLLNLLEASYASEESTIAVTALVLVELHGRARPMLVANHPTKALFVQPHATQATSTMPLGNTPFIMKATSPFSLSLQSQPLTLSTMMSAECLSKVGPTFSSCPSTRGGRLMPPLRFLIVLERAPCSVGILVDRGILSTSPSLFMARATFSVAVFFIGGADDAESLAYASRMARHECVCVTIVRFLLFGDENTKDRKRDSDLIDEYRCYNVGNRRFEILEEVVKDGIEMSTCIRRLIDYFDLVMVGREHPDSVMFQGHDQWSECQELGIIGDMLASPDFLTKASVLVVQQQRIRGRVIKSNINAIPLSNHKDQLLHDVPIHETLSPSCTISVDKYDKV
ncbi:Cation/H(+) antiporter 15, partial [Mucuna pruriens]